jgi:ppGpp synthetase/RelA/SpoT-type nucleotidyltranferase
VAADADRFASVHDAYSQQRAVFERVAEYVVETLTRLRWDLGLVHAEVAARAKEIDSVVQKISLRRKVETWEAMRDRAGARLVVSYLDDATRAVAWLQADTSVDVRKVEDKQEDLGTDKVGYLGYHLDVVIPGDAIEGSESVDGELWCEVQIRTAVQSAWSIVSHDIGYKRDPIPSGTARRFNRLMALAEIIDDEIGAVKAEVLQLPGMQHRRALYIARMIFGRFVPQPSSEETSTQTMPLLLRLYQPDEFDRLENILTTYAEADDENLRRIYRSRDTRTSPLLLQPEGLLMLERLNNDPFAARDSWPQDDLPMDLLIGMATVDGREKPMRIVGTD